MELAALKWSPCRQVNGKHLENAMILGLPGRALQLASRDGLPETCVAFPCLDVDVQGLRSPGPTTRSGVVYRAARGAIVRARWSA